VWVCTGRAVENRKDREDSWLILSEGFQLEALSVPFQIFSCSEKDSTDDFDGIAHSKAAKDTITVLHRVIGDVDLYTLPAVNGFAAVHREQWPSGFRGSPWRST
jgi:hypothetical protein